MKRIPFICLLLLLGGTASVFAQKRNFIFYKDTVTGKDTTVFNVSIKNENYRKKQYAVTITNNNSGITHTYKVGDLIAYKEGKTLFASQRFFVNGQVMRAFLPRVYWKETLSIFSFLPDDSKKKEYYVQLLGDSLLFPLKGSPETNGVNPLMTYLETFPVSQDETAKRYIRRMKPTPGSFSNRYRVCRTGNTNYIPKIRWGVLAGVGLADLSYSVYDFGQKFQGFAGLFADFPLLFGVSFHPELMYKEYSRTISLDKSAMPIEQGNAIYNRRDVVMPLMVRYTVIPLKGKVLPYIQAGVELEMAFKKETASQYRGEDADGYSHWVSTGPIALDKFTVPCTVGVGVEYKLNARHSLFCDVRYSKESQDTKKSGYYIVLSFNL